MQQYVFSSSVRDKRKRKAILKSWLGELMPHQESKVNQIKREAQNVSSLSGLPVLTKVGNQTIHLEQDAQAMDARVKHEHDEVLDM